ncbi:MAG: pilus assembly protein PilM [Planctomycetota bacterium]
MSVDQSAKLICGACNHTNESQAKFCDSCGHPLYESCHGCNKPVSLGQKFCGHCGFDLAGELRKRRTKYEDLLAKAIVATKRHEYDEALSLLGSVASVEDFRFRDVATSASIARDKVTQMRSQVHSGAAAAIQSAKQAFADGDRKQVVKLLEPIPDPLMDDDARRILGESSNFMQQYTFLKSELKDALDKKDWIISGSLLDQLLDLDPEHTKHVSLAGKVAEKLKGRAERRLAKTEYDNAVASLDAVPSIAQDEAFRDLRDRIDNAAWLAAQFDGEPYANATLGRLAMRFNKEVPTDKQASELVKQLAVAVKQPPVHPRAAWSKWKAPATSWLGGDARVFARPTSLEVSEAAKSRKFWGGHCAAIGLALQGLGLTRVQEQFAPKKGVLGGGVGGKSKIAWGLDIGSCGIRGALLRMEKGDEKPVVLETYESEFASPLCRFGAESNADELINEAIKEFLEKVQVDKTPVWVNLPASDLVSRFVILPPVDDKQAQKLMDAEASGRIPIPIEDLYVIKWVLDRPKKKKKDKETDGRGRPAFIGAARKLVVENRVNILTESGLKVSGLQSDAVALMNFIAFEFDQLHPVADQTKADDESNSESVDEALDDDLADGASSSKVPSVAILDAGASKTTLLLVSRESFWFWAHESGGEDLTARLAKATKLKLGEAEPIKRTPATMKHPQSDYQGIEQRMEEVRGRLRKFYDQALNEQPEFDVRETWCVGSGCLTHAWLRRVVLKNVS